MDYLSSFRNSTKEAMEIFLQVIEAEGGIEEYVTSLGFTQQQIESFRKEFSSPTSRLERISIHGLV